MVAQVHQEEAHAGAFGACLHLQVHVVLKGACFIGCPIDVKQGSFIGEAFEWQFQPFGVGQAHEVFRCP